MFTVKLFSPFLRVLTLFLSSCVVLGFFMANIVLSNSRNSDIQSFC